MHKTEVIKDNKILMNINENFYVNLNYNFQGIKVPEKIGIYLEKNIFNSLDFCHKDKVSLITINIFYYCDNHKDKINQLKKIFPIIKLENKILNSTFTINIDNLLWRYFLHHLPYSHNFHQVHFFFFSLYFYNISKFL